MSADRRRAMIVQTALPLLTRRGTALTTAEVARAAGIGEATVFRAFADKQALLDACVAEVLRPDPLLDQLARVERTRPLTDRLTEAATVIHTHLARLGAVLGALHAAGRSHRTPPPTGAAVRAAVAALFTPDADRLRLPADQLADLFLGLLSPPGPLATAAPSTTVLVDLFLHGALTTRDH
ncbi:MULTISPECIES: TetR/AcrR family transcriptional regulator [Micromonospora]|uniref:TetR/AcrR family transcriptional regulator n=1 Tax=Micromonospora antibiotica TaxID=2807623 RepID=A0ABS3V3U6_9ACTN|nr:TetR/AcrR family transcriptional regulator [Micromonospora antibiotica]MBO4160239.1 TetR/AcrR family transcriptional regulator [Micromonospora antibiotica]